MENGKKDIQSPSQYRGIRCRVYGEVHTDRRYAGCLLLDAYAMPVLMLVAKYNMKYKCPELRIYSS